MELTGGKISHKKEIKKMWTSEKGTRIKAVELTGGNILQKHNRSKQNNFFKAKKGKEERLWRWQGVEFHKKKVKRRRIKKIGKKKGCVVDRG